MNTIFTRASLKRSARTRTRKNSTGCSTTLQIIPECSENDLDSRVTLSAYKFSIDDALLMLNDPPRSPALSASSSTDDSNSEMPATPGASDDEELPLPTPRLRPKRISIRPLCITKTRSVVCADDEELAESTNVYNEEDEYDFYTRQFEDFISLYSPISSSAPISAPAPARPDSIILSPEVAPQLPVDPPKQRGRSRFSKALPLLPLPTPPPTSIPPVPQLPIPAIRRKRVIPPLPVYSPPPPPIETRPPPRMAVPSDIEDDILFEEEEQEPTRSIVIEQVWFDDEESIYSQPSFVPADIQLAPETPTNEMYLPRASTDSDAPRSSLDSSSSNQSHSSSSTSSSYEDSAPISPFSFPPTPRPENHQLRSRWSCSTISSLAPSAEPPRTILSPLRVVFGTKSKSSSRAGPGSRSRRAPPPLPIMSSPPRSRASPSSSPFQTCTNTHTQTQSPYKMPLTRMLFPTTPSPPSTPMPRHIRRQNSRSSTSSGSSETGSCESGGSAGLRRKPIPIEMFLRA
ncbi:hypothetical protein CY34DRAFT_812139 [Suillus luteus UH-Slu-Lm8-n1]|uniref:Uncharacterized protein n=1 Tax=Suillus luteus UH-Slu-Lm8-n1 TaxID=930992 RepID=A0A0D0A103_9AGAM|nr:hypothetical protein CY34DRAFT_812139 [Suillus luteus UH-Slu-Lm8-n1]